MKPLVTPLQKHLIENFTNIINPSFFVLMHFIYIYFIKVLNKHYTLRKLENQEYFDTSHAYGRHIFLAQCVIRPFTNIISKIRI